MVKGTFTNLLWRLCNVWLFYLCVQVKVNGTEYQPSVASSNKKHGRAQSAMLCLQELGLIPRGAQV